jgi:8-amino-7-oxononanoate synthase
MAKEREQIAHFCSRFAFNSHIHSVPIKGIARAKLASQYLASKGFDVRPVFSPTVPKGNECLRLIVHSFNTEREIEQCLKLIIP